MVPTNISRDLCYAAIRDKIGVLLILRSAQLGGNSSELGVRLIKKSVKLDAPDIVNGVRTTPTPVWLAR